MKKISLILISIALLSCVNKTAENNSTKAPTNQLEKLAGDFIFTEGPAVDAKGNIYFTDIPANLILIWTLDDKLDTFTTASGYANGLFFDKNGNLLACEGEKGQITSTSPSGEKIALATTYNNKRFNRPNDLWSDPKGGVYFTDPRYGNEDEELPQDGMHVYYINPDHTSVIRVCDDYEKPNGIVGTPDGKMIYITDNKAGKTFNYTIEEDGTLTNKSLFVEVGCDGMTLDKDGNVYVTTNGKPVVEVYSPSGELLNSIDIPEKPTNVCFGGKERDLLFITARTSIYRIKLDAKGVN